MGKIKKSNKKAGLKYYRKKNYIKSISFLEKALHENRKDLQLYLFLGNASLLAGDIDGARRYYRGGLEISEDDTELLKGLAFIYLKDERVEDAINFWGEVLEKNPKERTVKRALETLRSSYDTNEFIEKAKPQDFLSLKAPFLVKMKPYFTGIGITLGVIIVGIIFYTTPLYEKILQKFYPEIIELNRISLPEEDILLQEKIEESLYIYTEKEIKASFIRIKKYLYRNKVNTAIIALNRIMLSNASPLVKEKFEILYTFIDPPDPLSLDINPRMYEIMKEPNAFQGVYVLWHGRIANLKKEKKGINFDLLVNYINQDMIEGIARVDITGTYYLENGQMVEVFGSYTGYNRETGRLYIKGIFLRDLGLK